MSLWERVEQTLEGFVEGVFRKGFHGGIQPVEIARHLQRAMEEHRHVSVSHTYVPNDFTVRLHPDNLDALKPILRTLTEEFTGYLTQTADKGQLSFVGAPRVAFTPSEEQPPDTLGVDARFSEGPERQPGTGEREGGGTGTVAVSGGGLHTRRLSSDPSGQAPERDGGEGGTSGSPALVLLGPGEMRKFPLEFDQPVVIGRGSMSDIPLPDSSVSRSHARIEETDRGYYIVDLGSTNGTLLNERPVMHSRVEDGDHVRVGAYTFRFEGGK